MLLVHTKSKLSMTHRTDSYPYNTDKITAWSGMLSVLVFMPLTSLMMRQNLCSTTFFYFETHMHMWNFFSHAVPLFLWTKVLANSHHQIRFDSILYKTEDRKQRCICVLRYYLTSQKLSQTFSHRDYVLNPSVSYGRMHCRLKHGPLCYSNLCLKHFKWMRCIWTRTRKTSW